MSDALTKSTCPRCGIDHWYSRGTHEVLKGKDKSAFCPNGHGFGYTNPGIVAFRVDIISVFTHLTCPECGIPFGVTSEYFSIRADEASFCCPGGHRAKRIGGMSTTTLLVKAGKAEAGKDNPASPGTTSTTRIGDTERDKAMGRITEAYAAGQIQLAELDGALADVLTASRKGELEKIMSDLDLPSDPSPAPKPEPARRIPKVPNAQLITAMALLVILLNTILLLLNL